MDTRFYFAICQTGAEKAVKAEVLAEHPQLRFAFSRPGFVTFKDAEAGTAPLTIHRGIFARLWGEVISQTRDPQELPALLALIPTGAIAQCFDRDQYVPGDEPEGFARDAKIRAILAGNDGFISAKTPRVGDKVYSVIWVDDFHVFLGLHVHAANLAPAPGNAPEIPLPAESPSRAYLKIEEAIYRFHPEVKPGWKALEVGCAPGGATTALLNRGFTVTGIDPQYMDERIYARQGFTHVRKPARYATPDDLRKVNPDWLVMDMSIPPRDALAELSHVIQTLRGLYGKELKIRQGFLTIKLNDWKYAGEIADYLARLEKIGFHDLHPTQLCSNRQEFFVFAERFA
jgi:23S rRNA (cytidine2498-2'-O)-methyltransferase